MPTADGKETEEEKQIRIWENLEAQFSRNGESSTHGVHQIIAISEKGLNSILATRFNTQSTLSRDVRLRTFHHADEQGEIDAKLGVPHIQLVPPSNPSTSAGSGNAIATVLFYLNFSSGFFKWSKGGETVTQRLENWSVAFHVPLEVAKLSGLPDDIAAKLKHTAEGDVSAAQILLSLSAATLAGMDFSASTLPGLPSDQQKSKETRAEFEKYMERYLSYLKTGAYSVLGYTIRLEESKHAPKGTVIPKSSRILVQSYKQSKQALENKLPPKKGLDMLVFLQMTTEKGKELEQYDPAKAVNWVLPDPLFSACLVLERHLYIEAYLLEKLSPLNIACVAAANDIFHWSYGVADAPLHHKDWNISRDGKPTAAPFHMEHDQPPNNQPTMHFGKYLWKTEWNANQLQYGDFWAPRCSDNLKITVDNMLTWQPATNVSMINLTINFQRKVVVKPEDMSSLSKPQHGNWLNVFGDTYIHLNWLLQMTLSTIEHGKLAVEIQQQRDPNYVVGKDWRSMPVLSMVSSADAHKSLQEAIMARIKQGFEKEQIRTDQAKVLNSQSQYVFPGGGEFFMKNPVYNRNGDLVVDLNFETPEIAIEYDFRLAVDTSLYKHITKPWVKLESDQDGAQLILVATKDQATQFMIDNGNLIVVTPKPNEPGKMSFTKYSLFLPGPTETRKKLFFVRPNVFNKVTGKKTKKPEEGIKLEFATTGSLFEFKASKSHADSAWQPTFVLSDDTEPKIQLYTGKREDAKDKFFLLDVKY